jgi:hypothetical protein
MKVLVYSNFGKNKIWTKIKSPSSMKNGRFHPPKCRGCGAASKNGSIAHPFFQNTMPILIIPKKK